MTVQERANYEAAMRKLQVPTVGPRPISGQQYSPPFGPPISSYGFWEQLAMAGWGVHNTLNDALRSDPYVGPITRTAYPVTRPGVHGTMAFGIIPLSPSNEIRSYGDIVDGVDDTPFYNTTADSADWYNPEPPTYDPYVPVSVNAKDETTTPANQQAWNAVTNLLTSTLTNVTAPALTNLVNSSVYGQPSYYVKTADGKQAPVWKAADGRFFSIDASGAQTWLPATPAAPPGTKFASSAQWMTVAAIGAAALLLITLVIKKR